MGLPEHREQFPVGDLLRIEERAEHGMPLGNGESRLLSAGKSLGGHDNLGLVATKEHSFCLLGCINVLDHGAHRDLLQSEADYGLVYCARARLRPGLAQQISPAVRTTS